MALWRDLSTVRSHERLGPWLVTAAGRMAWDARKRLARAGNGGPLDLFIETLVDDTAGLYCLAVDERFRRQGLATAVIQALLQAATTTGVRWVWLSVLEDNEPARALYERLGFRTVSKYHYRVKA